MGHRMYHEPNQAPNRKPPSLSKDVTEMKRAAVAKRGILILAIFAYVAFESLPERNIPPKLADFTPPYTCPATNTPTSCTAPVKITVECADIHTIHKSNLTRTFTETEIANTEKACELLPKWLDQDPRIEISDPKNANTTLRYQIFPSGNQFRSALIYLENDVIQIIKHNQPDLRPASYFVEQSIIELDRQGYLP